MCVALAHATDPVMCPDGCAEEGRSTSLDVTRTDGPVSYTATVFGSRIAHAVHVDRSDGLVLTNLPEPSTNLGLELLGTVRHPPYSQP